MHVYKHPVWNEKVMPIWNYQIAIANTMLLKDTQRILQEAYASHPSEEGRELLKFASKAEKEKIPCKSLVVMNM